MNNTRAPRLRNYTGHAFWSYGFRPFFLLGALHSGLTVLLWLPQFYGELQLSSLFAPVDWHIHEMFFGYLTAVIAGFLFTAIPNWTGRLPFRGAPLAFLVLIWVAGRIAVTFSAQLGWLPTMLIDLSFLVAITFVMAREIISGKNWRNLKVLLPLGVLLVANVTFHLEFHFLATSDFSRRLALGAVLTLVITIGGRIIPSFTRNWLVRHKVGALQKKFALYDIVSMGISVFTLLVWAIMGSSIIAGSLFAIAALFQLVRLLRWGGVRTWREPLVVTLHISYLFIPVGFALLSLSGLWPNVAEAAAGIHALSVGAIGAMTLSVMIRVTRGHTGRPVRAGYAEITILSSIFVSAFARIVAVFASETTDILLHLAAFSWALAFLVFVVSFAPMLMKPRSGENETTR